MNWKNESLHLHRVWIQFIAHIRSNNWQTKMWTEEKEMFDSMENVSVFGLLAFAAEFAWCENSKNSEKKLAKRAPLKVNRSNIM
ncbi:hypothetical protein Y032_0064g3554 [Ancylostoma ceylanicum]|uniref:Uncharacterized protein n=1 Tax=Ancylostoma ceylanicum TaxID=53326 RepID=A0A016U143_9BILA|nr:hypothetical protein Y032_0064g3554 [Ancylostoma ceylanicum]